MTLAGIEGPIIEPGSAEWLRTMSASKVAAVLGLSPWESPFSIWHRMNGAVPQEETDEMRRGHYLEPAVARWFADQRPDLTVGDTGTWTNIERPWQTATPDRCVWEFVEEEDGSGYVPTAVLEIKTASDREEWGEQDTDEIPVYYRAQVMWQMDTIGVPVAHVAVLTAFLEFRKYVVHYNAAEAELIREAVREFLDTLEAGTPPPLDGHDATYEMVRALHPEIDGTTVEISPELAAGFIHARNQLAIADLRWTLRRAELAMAMGQAKKATSLSHTIATRQAKGDGDPFVIAARSLPESIEQPGSQVA